MFCGVTPSRAAVSRSITRCASSPSFCWSLATSRNSGRLFSAATTRPLTSASSVAFASSSVNWYCVRLTRSSTVKSCNGCKKHWIPFTCATCGCNRCMMARASSVRWSRSFKLIWMRPLFSVVFVPSTPMNDDTLSTSGSFKMISASCSCRCAIAL